MARVNAKTAITTTDSVKSVNQAAKKTVGSILQAMPVSYTHLTLPTKRIV